MDNIELFRSARAQLKEETGSSNSWLRLVRQIIVQTPLGSLWMPESCPGQFEVQGDQVERITIEGRDIYCVFMPMRYIEEGTYKIVYLNANDDILAVSTPETWERIDM